MKTTKSKAAYTNKWLSRNRHLWHETAINGIKIIILDKNDAPNIVVERIKEINYKRGYGSLNKPQPKKSANNKSVSTYTEKNSNEDDWIDNEKIIDCKEYDEYYDDDDL